MRQTADEQLLPADVDASLWSGPRPRCGRSSAASRRARARAALAASAGRAVPRRRLLPPGATPRAGRPAGRPADVSARRRAAGRGRRLGRLERRPTTTSPSSSRSVLPDGGIAEIYAHGATSAIAGTAVHGRRAGRARGRRLPRHRSLALRHGCQESAWMLAASRSSTATSRAAARTAPRSTGAASSGAPRAQIVEGSWDVLRSSRDGQLRLDGRRRLPAGAAHDGPRRGPARQPVERWPDSRTRCRPRPGWGPTTAR
jgi:hypothetical protein